jgi:hypothetical protein
MSVRFQISFLIYMIVQGFLFGVGTIIVLTTPLSASATQILPWIIGVTAIASMPLSWMIAPQLLARFESHSASPPRPIVAHKSEF